MRKVITAVALVVAASTVSLAQAPAAAREDLSGLPESQVVLFVNARRITAEALPAVMSPAKFNEAADQLLSQTNIDLRKIDSIVAGARLDGDLKSGATAEGGVIVRGGFNADALISLVRLVAPGKYREETRGGKSITIFKTDTAGGEDKDANAPKPKLAPPTEIAAVALDAGALLVGTPAYVNAAIDARGGAGARVRGDLVDLAMRDEGALVSLAADVPPSLSSYIDPQGGARMDIGVFSLNDEARRLIDSLRQVQFSLNMTAAQFGAQLAARTDAPENASAISGLVATGLNAIQQEANKAAARKGRAQSASDAQALAGLKSIPNTAEGTEVVLALSVPRATVASYVQQAMAKKPAAKPATRTTARPAARRRAPARRRD